MNKIANNDVSMNLPITFQPLLYNIINVVSVFTVLYYMLIKFAVNIGIDFYTPEEFFLKQKPAPFEWPTFVPVCITQGLRWDNNLGEIQGKYKVNI